LWAERAGSEGVEYGYEVACDIAGNAYVTGVAGTGSQFGNFILPESGMFVCKYNADGSAQWLASSINAGVIAISVEPDVSTTQIGMVCGRLTGSGAIGSFPFSSIDAGDDAYWAVFDASSGTWTDMQYYGGSGADKGKDCDCGAYPVFLASFEAQAIFGGLPFNSNGEADLILGYGNFSTLQWTASGGQNSEVPACVKLLPNGKIAVAGWHFGLSQFGNLTIDTGHIANQNAFIACLNPQTNIEDPLLPHPSKLKLSPNPFSESLKISLERTSPEINTIDIYNLKGQKVRSIKLSNPNKAAQNYAWDGCDFAGNKCSAGVYILKAGNNSQKALKLH
ncbi:MAG: FlgD immunoglobulin-like domain containing protein, partial [Candidatus Cloacimonas sp.]|nr:FlgD immunoglobulin-like domain containing protein [Candidatus Cloacimonas sp.]